MEIFDVEIRTMGKAVEKANGTDGEQQQAMREKARGKQKMVAKNDDLGEGTGSTTTPTVATPALGENADRAPSTMK